MKRKKIVVFGSYVADLTGTAERLPKAGETVFGEMFKIGPGGKGSNQAVAAHRAGADVRIITKLGNDVFGTLAMEFYKENDIATDNILLDSKMGTGVALINVNQNSGQNQILVVPGACMNFTEENIDRIRPAIENSDILLVQLEVNMDALEKVVGIAKGSGVKVVLNPAPARELPIELLEKVDIITPNETEAETLTSVSVDGEARAAEAADVFHSQGIRGVVITMGKHGSFVSEGGKAEMIPAYRVQAVDTTGAGDAFNGGLVTAIAEGKNIFEAARFGNALASLSVQKFGTAPSMPSREEVDRVLLSV